MDETPESSGDKRQLINAIFIPGIIVIFMIISFLFEKGMNLDFHYAGVFPRKFENIWGIFTLVFVHGNLDHLFNHILSFFILGSFLFYFYRQIAPKVLIILYICSGFVLWLIGRDCWHIGASGLIYSLAFFLFFSGLFRKHIPLIAVSLIVTLIYGSLVWHIFPWQIHDPVSWEGHLAGGISGTILSVYLKNKPPQRPSVVWNDDENDNIIFYEEEEEQKQDNQIIEINKSIFSK